MQTNQDTRIKKKDDKTHSIEFTHGNLVTGMQINLLSKNLIKAPRDLYPVGKGGFVLRIKRYTADMQRDHDALRVRAIGPFNLGIAYYRDYKEKIRLIVPGF